MMYSVVNMLTSMVSIATFIYGLVKGDKRVWITGLVVYFCFPIVYEILLNIKAMIFRNSLAKCNCS